MCAAMHKRRVRGELTKVHAFPAAATATAPREFGPTFGPGLGPEADEDGDDDSNDAESNDFRSDYLVTPPGVEVCLRGEERVAEGTSGKDSASGTRPMTP